MFRKLLPAAEVGSNDLEAVQDYTRLTARPESVSAELGLVQSPSGRPTLLGMCCLTEGKLYLFCFNAEEICTIELNCQTIETH